MKNRRPHRLAWLAAASLAILPPMIGCMGASDDKLGSGGPGVGSGIDDGMPIKSTTQANRQDKGDNPQAGVGTARKENVDAAKTGGMGEYRPGVPTGPGDTGPNSATAPGVGPK